MAVPTPAEGVRAQAREQMRAAILGTARSHLAEHGATGLSLRAVARDVGMVSSAVYRYFPSRDALLTALIIDAYDSLGTAAERAEARVARHDHAGRFAAVATAARRWALAERHQYALVYGSPVPGYAAPQDTVGPATRVPRLLADLLVDIAERDGAAERDGPEAARGRPGGWPAAVDEAVAPVGRYTEGRVPTDLLVRGVMAWTYVFGAISFELFGQRHQVIDEERADAFFAEECRRLTVLMGVDPA